MESRQDPSGLVRNRREKRVAKSRQEGGEEQDGREGHAPSTSAFALLSKNGFRIVCSLVMEVSMRAERTSSIMRGRENI